MGAASGGVRQRSEAGAACRSGGGREVAPGGVTRLQPRRPRRGRRAIRASCSATF